MTNPTRRKIPAAERAALALEQISEKLSIIAVYAQRQEKQQGLLLDLANALIPVFISRLAEGIEPGRPMFMALENPRRPNVKKKR
jgi:hypothetical protein